MVAPNFRAHVANSTLAGGAQAFCALPEILDDGPGAALHGKDTGHLQNHVFGRGPAAHFAGQLHANHLREFQFPGHARHHIHGICAAHTDGHHAQAPGVGGVRIGANHHAAGESIVFQHHLVNNARAGLPKTNAVLVGNRSQEVVYFLIFGVGFGQIFGRAVFGLDEVVAMH